MNIRKNYPKLFKSLAKGLGARKAKVLLESLHVEYAYLGLDFSDARSLGGSFSWKKSVRGFDYWLKIARDCYGRGREVRGDR